MQSRLICRTVICTVDYSTRLDIVLFGTGCYVLKLECKLGNVDYQMLKCASLGGI